jgi:succinate dehydrogenase hydrophobic anchor subunit
VRDQRLWTWHLAAGAVILVFLGLHMTVMHLEEVLRVFNPDPGEPIAWANVVARAKSGFFLVSYIALLAAALFHGFYGLRNIVFELNPGAGAKRALNGLLVTVGLILFAVGTWAAWTAFQAARASAA